MWIHQIISPLPKKSCLKNQVNEKIKIGEDERIAVRLTGEERRQSPQQKPMIHVHVLGNFMQ